MPEAMETDQRDSLPQGVTEGSGNQEVTLVSEWWMCGEGGGASQRLWDMQGPHNQAGRRRDELGGATGHSWLDVDQTQVQA